MESGRIVGDIRQNREQRFRLDRGRMSSGPDEREINCILSS